ncbi:MAG: DUF1538 domain-containing protein [Candidatus Sericytochromatia bacterium]|nr:DUF1538 domain-containing protein [Candidatus Tanganyikabacteria bacterium]
MVTFKETLGLLGPYAWSRLLEQIKAVAILIVYLIFFQTVVLGIPLAEATVIAIGLSLVIVGLAFFMEGLVLGLMPLGEVIGIKLPQKAKLPTILVFAFILGMGATFAEPAVGILKAAGSSVKAWEAPLLFLLLNKYSAYLVYAVGIGVGLAVVAGTLRFLYSWSLKPFIYVLVMGGVAVSIWAAFDPNIRYLTGVAWDCGGVTTGPVTVPLVLALGIGICRVAGGSDSQSSEAGGFGVVTLASIFPVLGVMALGFALAGTVPQPMPDTEFFGSANRAKVEALFASRQELVTYALTNASPPAQLALFDGKASDLAAERAKLAANPAAGQAVRTPAEILQTNALAAAQAIIPLTLLLALVLLGLLREKLPRADEVALGVVLAVIGMTIFNIGIELGLAKIGNQVGGKLPSAYEAIELPDSKRTIPGFDPALVETAIAPDGKKREFFYAQEGSRIVPIPYKAENHDKAKQVYDYVPTRGPLFGGSGDLSGILVVLLFAFIMGYGATLAEPALNALGATVEQLTVGTFKKSLLMQAVALGVGVGIALGVAKIVWDLPLIWLLAPPYVLLMFITWISTEEFVNIGWDSAGVTTGPITVPLVLAMGLGIGTQAGVVEGFGILAMASVCPILSVLLVGLVVTRKRKAALKEIEGGQQGAEGVLTKIVPPAAEKVPQA